MTHSQPSTKNRRPLALVLGAGAALACLLTVTTLTLGRPSIHRVALLPEPGTYILDGLTYSGNPSCAGSKCHSAADCVERDNGDCIGDEMTIAIESDPHARSYNDLFNTESKAIASAMGIGAAHESDRCLQCHAANVPAAQRGERFDIEAGNSCESCHGPSEKYLKPHEEAGWTQAQRAKLGTAGLRTEWGVLDTTDKAFRAEMCVACHLQIDKDMLDAGHPPLQFEMYAYNYYIYSGDYRPHWEEPFGEGVDAKLWAIGQVVAHEAAQAQLADWTAKGWDTTSAKAMVDLYAKGAEIVKTAFGTDSAAKLNGMTPTPAQCAAACAALARAGAGASNEVERKIFAFGVTALGSAVYDAQDDDAPDDFWDASDAATDASGDAYTDALQTMADLAQKGAG
ncbi:MAG: multiheme c-type cytochrome [Phycisphaerales bacterium]